MAKPTKTKVTSSPAANNKKRMVKTRKPPRAEEGI